MQDKKMWGGRFQGAPDEKAFAFQASIGFDKRLYRQDIEGSLAHAAMLTKQGILTREEGELIDKGLREVLADLDNGSAELSEADEDIHMNVERLLTRKIGDVGKKLHTGRSRNDQVATDMRLFMLQAGKDTISHLETLCHVILDIAQDNTQTYMSAYTHLQKAQPTSLAHYLMAYFEMFYRDIQRFLDCQERTAVLPLGSGALCGTTYPLDREYVAQQLGFADITRNSMDGVSDRDFVIEYLSDASICMMHLSRLCEELVLFSTNEFGYVDLSDAYATGSSIMPQKRNPDMAELIRGKTGRVYGDLVGLLTTMKGLPLAYNKDMQEDKEGVFDAIDTLNGCLEIAAGMLHSATYNKEKLAAGARRGFTNATDVADYLVRKGVPFRDAHAIVGRLVLRCEHEHKGIEELSLTELKEYSDLIEGDVYDAVSVEACVQARSLPGGPAVSAVEEHIKKARQLLATLPEA